MRHVVTESNSVRSGGWQQTVGTDLRGKTLGVLGLGNIGSQVARVGSWQNGCTEDQGVAVSNSDAVKGYEGHHVILLAQVDADKNTVHVVSLKMAKDGMAK